MRNGYSRSLSSDRRSELHSKSQTRALRSALIVLLIVLSSLVIVESGVAQSDGDRSLYENDELFNQLSGAYRTKLERLFGKKQELSNGKLEVGQTVVVTPHVPMLNPLDGSLSALANTLVNNAAADATSQDTQSETALVLGSGSNVICGFNDSGSYLGGALHFTGWSQSGDGGTTWADNGVLPTSVVGDAGDPVLASSNNTGTVFLATLGFSSGGNLQMFRSSNNGVSFLSPVSSTPGFTSPSHDKEWIAVDNTPGTGYGNVYQFWRNFGTGGGMTFTRSVDDGLTWTPNGGLLLASGTGQGAAVVVGSDHSVYCFWYNSSGGRSIVFRKSVDQGVSFAAQQTVTTLTSTGTNGDLGLGSFRSSSFPQVEANLSNGQIYVVYPDPTAVSGGDRGNIWLRYSDNGGTTWSAATKLNNDVGTNAQFSPAIAVTPDGSAICVTWYDRRSDPANVLIERWGVIGTVSGSTITWGANFRISSQFPVVVGVDPVINATYMGDYDQMAGDNSFFYTVWGDNRDQSIAVPSRKNANVRFAKIPKAGPGPILDYVSTVITGGNGNGGVDANECNDLAITLKNNGSATATGIVATLAQTGGNPEVDVRVGTQSYANLSAGATGTNTTSFQLSTTGAFACGSTITLTLTITHSGGTDVSTFTIPTTGPLGPASQFDNNTVTPIPDFATTDIPITVSEFTGTIADVNVSFYLTHTYDSDLSISLISPDATIVDLSSNNGSSGDNYGSACSPQASRTTFDDAASTSITAGTAPFVGTFKPEGLLSSFNGKTGAAVNGTWTLRIVDGASQDVGTFNCVTLSISPVGTCPQGPGECAPLPIQLSNFVGTVINGNNIRLDWTTISEINNYGFEVQKSVMQPGNFVTIPGSFIPGHGTTNEPQHYSFVDYRVEVRTVYYRLRQIDLDGSVNYSEPIRVDVLTGVEENEVPSDFSLGQNYPNPFNPSTVIKYGLPVASSVRLAVFNTLGQQVAVLVNERQEAGFHSAVFQNTALSSGVYFYTIETGQFRASKKLLLLR